MIPMPTAPPAFACLLAIGSLSHVGLTQSALVLLVAALAFPALVAAAYNWPLATMVLYLLVGPMAALLQMTPVGRPLDGVGMMGIYPSTAVLLAMLGAVAWRSLTPLRGRRSPLPAGLRWTAAAFAAWLFFEVARNLPVYGAAAGGELRSSYLILAMPAYVALLFTDPRDRRKLAAITIIATSVVTVAVAPIVGLLKGWGSSYGHRFFPASLSLGLLFGWLALFLGVRSHALRVSATLLWLLAIPVGVLLLVDSHRSVWLVAATIPLALLVFGEIDLRRIPGWLVPAAAAAGLALLLVTAAGVNLAPYLMTRAAAFSAPDQDPTAAWRQTQWRAQLAIWRQEPVAGRGLGGYWEEGRDYGGAGVMPHNLYVQILTKLGVVGLILWLLTAVNAALFLGRALVRLRRQRRRSDVDYVLVLMGLVALVSLHIYGIAYALDAYALLFTGLGIAAAACADDGATSSSGELTLRDRTVRTILPMASDATDPAPAHPAARSHLEWSTEM